jgi:hypothetical protein
VLLGKMARSMAIWPLRTRVYARDSSAVGGWNEIVRVVSVVPSLHISKVLKRTT